MDKSSVNTFMNILGFVSICLIILGTVLEYRKYKRTYPEKTVWDFFQWSFEELYKYFCERKGSYNFLVDVSKREDWNEEDIQHRLWKLRYRKQRRSTWKTEDVDEAIWLLEQTLRKTFSAPVGEPDKASAADRMQLLIEERDAKLKELQEGTDVYEHTQDMYDQKIGRIKEEL